MPEGLSISCSAERIPCTPPPNTPVSKLGRKLLRTPEFHAPIRILCFTWNIGNAMPNPEELSHWLPLGASDLDLIAVATQESSFSRSKASRSQVREDSDGEEEEGADESPAAAADAPGDEQHEWDAMVSRQLGADWCVCSRVVLWSMRLIIFAHSKHMEVAVPCIHSVECGSSATGVGGILGNKGGLVVKLGFGQTSLAFVACHLAAHQPKLHERNANCKEVLWETMRSVGSAQ